MNTGRNDRQRGRGPRRPPRDQPRRGAAERRTGPRRKSGDAADRSSVDRISVPRRDAGWDHVAAWYDRLVGDEGSDYHRNVILPAALRLLDPQPGERILDLCCGQGVLARALLAHEPELVLAVDASPRLIAAAKERGPRDPRIRFVVRDARRLDALADGRFDAAALIMAVQDLAELPPVLAGLGRALRVGGRAVLVMMHPCFRIPRQTEWGWDAAKRTQYRRVDRYATPLTIPIATHPGSAPGQQTFFHHRPLAEYVNALAAGGLAICGAEELLTHRRSEPGGHSRGENRAADEFPVFLALKALKLDVPKNALAPPRAADSDATGEANA
jgi:ubiquinone/menaquinone biosynthesis C-methylase UbiE